VLREVAQRKPVVLWKGGQTEAGTRATLSHTASLTSSHAVWQALARQANCISVDSLDELIDVLQLLLRAKPSAGRRLALLAQTGGQSVVLTDAFAKVGMEVPELTAESYARLAEFFNIIGGSYRNPLDMAGTVNQHPEHLDRIFAIIDADPHIDAIVMELSALFMARRWLQHPEQFADLVERLERHRARSAKPFLTVLHPGHLEAEVASLRPRLQERGIPVLPSFERAARALARVTAYQRARAELEAAPA
jgi:acyl-CoA synthetase (NDP forming)